jgi:rsbT antagonist protein RsbS
MVEQMLVSILRQGSYLIASIHEALNDREIVQFQRDLIEQIGTHRARGVIIDVAALDVMDSFGSRTLLNLAHAARLRGAETVIVGIQPTVAFAMVRLGMGLDNVHTALDLEEGLEYLQRLLRQGPEQQGMPTSGSGATTLRPSCSTFPSVANEGAGRPTNSAVGRSASS